MILNIFLIVIGFLTSVIGIWNIFTGSYIWGTLFGLGGIWSIWLGTLYVIQDREEEKLRKAQIQKQQQLTDSYNIPIDEGILSEDLFEISDEMKRLIPTETDTKKMKNSEINPVNQRVIRLDEFTEDPSNVSIKIIVADDEQNSDSKTPDSVTSQTVETKNSSNSTSE